MNTFLPPIMGWSSWNVFRQNIDQEKIMSIAHALVDTGLKDAGYQYLNFDDCWQSSTRSFTGSLQFDLTRFPIGADIIQKIHALELKVGLYSSCGVMTCEDLPGSYGLEEKDAQTFYDWGVDFLKYDYCHVVDLKSDEPWLTQAPLFSQIEFYNQKTKQTIRFFAHEGQLTGKATLISSTPNVIDGLSHHRGTILFNQTIPAGDYVATITYQKQKNEQRHLLVLDCQKNQQKFIFHFPRSSGWSTTGRIQKQITLNEAIECFSLNNPIHDQQSDAQLRYETMHQALKKSYNDEPFVYSICEHGRNKPWKWAPPFAHQYRISYDIENSWASVLSCYQQTVELIPYAVEGSYLDPDMLEIGNHQLTTIENQSHFVLWAFLAAPLILGNDLREWAKEPTIEELKIVTNPEIIAFNQSRPYLPAAVSTKNEIDLLVKVLENGDVGCVIFNKGEVAQSFKLDFASLPTQVNGLKLSIDQKNVVEVWGKTFEQQADNLFIQNVLPHEVFVFKFFDNK